MTDRQPYRTAGHRPDRRRLLSAALGTGAALSLGAPAVARDRGILFTMATDRPAEAKALADRLSAVSDGRFTLAVETVTSEGRADLSDRVGSGQIDFYLACENKNVSRDPAFGLFASIPMGMTPGEFQAWRIAGNGQTLWDALAADHGIKPLAAGDDGPQALWTRRPVTDASGLGDGPIGSVGLGLHVLRAMGLEALDLTTPGLNAAHLSAVEGITLPQMKASGLIETFPYMVTPNGNRPMAARSAGMNLLLWLALTDDDRFLVQRVFDAHHAHHSLRSQHKAANGLADGRETILRLAQMPDDHWDRVRKAATAQMQGLLEDEGPGRAAAVDYLYFLEDIAPWSEVGEARYSFGRKVSLDRPNPAEDG